MQYIDLRQAFDSVDHKRQSWAHASLEDLNDGDTHVQCWVGGDPGLHVRPGVELGKAGASKDLLIHQSHNINMLGLPYTFFFTLIQGNKVVSNRHFIMR